MLKSEKLKVLENVDYDLLTEEVSTPDKGVICHPTGVTVRVNAIPHTAGRRRRRKKR